MAKFNTQFQTRNEFDKFIEKIEYEHDLRMLKQYHLMNYIYIIFLLPIITFNLINRLVDFWNVPGYLNLSLMIVNYLLTCMNYFIAVLNIKRYFDTKNKLILDSL